MQAWMKGRRTASGGLLALFLAFLALGLPLPIAAQNDDDCILDIDYRASAADLTDEHDYSGAYNAYTCVVQALPEDWEAHLNRARLALWAAFYENNFDVDMTTDLPLVAANAPDLLQTALDQANTQVAYESQNVEALLWRAYVSYYQNNLDPALTDVEQALQVAPDSALLHTLRGIFETYIGNGAEATTSFSRALELAPESAGLASLIGLIYVRTNDFEQAVDYYSLAIDRDSDNPQYWSFRGFSSMQLNDIDSALSDFDSAIALDPNNADYYIDRGSAYQLNGDWDGVIENMTRAIELDDTYEFAYSTRAAAYVFSGRYEEALADYDTAQALDPTDVFVPLGRGTTRLILGDVAAGASDYLAYVDLIEETTSDVELGALQPGTPLPLDLHQGWVYYVPFEADEHDQIHAVAHSPNDDVDTIMVLLDPNGQPLTGSDDNDNSLDAEISDYEVPEKGTYTLVVTHAGGGNEGAVELTLELTAGTEGTSRGG